MHDRLLRLVQSLIDRGRRGGAFRTDLPNRSMFSSAFSLMHAAAEHAAAGRLIAQHAADLITRTRLVAFTLPGADARAAPHRKEKGQ